MKNVTSILLASLVAIGLAGCKGEPSTKQIQAMKAEEAANSISFTENAEIDNIKRRLELTSKVGLVGYVVLFNEMGQPVMYTTVKGKITSGSKRLTRPDVRDCGGSNCVARQASSDEGTYGSSNPYVFFWTQSDQYVQWSGNYLYSDKPIRLRQEPVVIDVQ